MRKALRKSDHLKPVVGVIGGIGSGKTLVAEELGRLGGHVVSGDALGHKALRQPDIRAKVIEKWGRAVVAADGEIDRRQLGRIVFADAEQKKALEALTHPFIERGFRTEIARVEKDVNIAFTALDAAVLLEAGWNEMCTHVVFVDAPRQIRLERLQQKRRWTEADLAAREKAQMPLDEKRKRADVIIPNAACRDELTKHVESFVRQLVASSGHEVMKKGGETPPRKSTH